MSSIRFVAGALLALAPLAAVQAQEPPKQRLSLEHYLEFETVSNPQISPDGRQIVYTRGWIDRVNDARKSSLWVMNADGTRPRALLEGSAAAWSPDGTRIAYLAQGQPRGTQIWVRYMDAEGAATQVARLNETPSNLAWSPDGRYLAFNMVVPDNQSWSVKLPDRPEGAKWTETPRIIERPVYRRDGRGFLEQGYMHVFIVPAEGGAPRQITSGDFDHGAPEWTPDGKTVVFSTLRETDAPHRWRESHIYAVGVDNGAVRQLTQRRGLNHSPVVSPDGRRIAFLGYDWTTDTYRDNDLYVMNLDGSGVRRLTESLDRAPERPIWSSDSRELYFNVASEGSFNLHAVTLDGRVRTVTRGVHDLRVASMSRGGEFVGVRSALTEPAQVVRLSARNAAPRTLTRLNETLLANVELGEVEEVWYPSHDGRYRIQGWIIKPPQFDPGKKYPLQLHIHGGPHAMYGVGFNFGWQEHAANDYVVLYTNPRGSTGYGSEFGNAIKNAYPGDDYHDLMLGVDELLKRGYVDERNLFVTGCSGGGVLTAWIVGQTDRFRAASANCPVTNWLSFVGTTDGIGWYRNFEKHFWEDPSEHLRRSPIMYVGNVKTPTMLMTGVNDLRTPMAQTEEYYQALQVLKVPTAMVRFNDEFHGTGSKPSNFMRTQLYLRSWFERWMTEDGLQKQHARTHTADAQ